MSNLQFLRTRIQSIKSTQKMTSAMKLVASAHFRRAEQRLSHARIYAKETQKVLDIATHLPDTDDILTSLLSPGPGNHHVLILIGADRGLCGGFNMNVSRFANAEIRRLIDERKKVSLIVIGLKAISGLYGPFKEYITDRYDVSQDDLEGFVNIIVHRIVGGRLNRTIDSCSMITTHFRSVMVSTVKTISLIPYVSSPPLSLESPSPNKTLYTTDPKRSKVIDALLIDHLKAQLYFALFESQTSEQSTRMMAMENATKNSKDMLDKLEILYNRTRQAAITKELIEIVAGAESV